MKNKVIIVGEQYWFYSKETFSKYESVIENADTLLNILNRNSKYEFIILEGPKNLVNKIRSININEIKAIFFFHDPFSDSILNNMTIKQIYDFLSDLEKKNNIFIYPGLDKTILFASKKYYKILVDELNHLVLPKSIVVEIKNYEFKKSEKFLNHILYKKAKSLLEIFEKIMIKKGYSYSGVQVRKFNRTDIESKKIFAKKSSKLNFKKFWNVGSNAISMDKGIDRYYILQGYNKDIKSKFNEYRIFFIHGKATYITWTDDWDNLCTEDIESSNNLIEIQSGISENIRYTNLDGSIDKSEKLPINKSLAIEILRFAKKAYKEFLPHLNKLDKERLKQKDPIILRLDISYATDQLFQDEHSVKVDGFETPVRIYVNEIEIDPTHYFYNNMLCKTNKKIDSDYIQAIVGNGIINILDSLN